MLLFSTVLDVKRELDRNAFRALVVEWNQKSRHEENIIPGLAWKDEKSLKCGSDDLWLAAEELDREEIIAVRYEKRKADGIIWDTDYVMNFKERKLAVRLERSYTEDANLGDYYFATPYFISQLIKNDMLPMDDDLPILNRPIIVNDDNIGILARVIKEEKRYKYPVIFVSRTPGGNTIVDVDLLASRLKGAAHVLVQETPALNGKIREACEDRNEYNGTIGVYFPNPAIKKARYFTHAEDGAPFDQALLETVIRRVFQYCNSKLVDPLQTWQGVNNALLLSRVATQFRQRQIAEAARNKAEEAKRMAEEAKKKAEEEKSLLEASMDEKEKQIWSEAKQEATDQAIESFVDDMSALEAQIAALTKENERLMAENQGMRAKYANVESTPLLMFGEEHDYYPGEIKDMILLTLEESLKTFRDKSRRRDVVKDIIESNDYQGMTKKRDAEIRALLKSFNGMDGKLKQNLEALGFDIDMTGPHIRVTYYGDPRYEEMLSKTPSDWRTGKISQSKLTNMTC
ncbi:MAG: hypothetical protein J5636_11070 [Clostridiales bacterium]|nr:hypothetical protein [Clostridiales bacterium]